MKTRGNLIVAACVTYIAIVVSNGFMLSAHWEGNPTTLTLAVVSLLLLLLDCGMVVLLCVTTDPRVSRAGWIALGSAGAVWLLSIHLWISFYAYLPYLPGMSSSWAARVLLFCGHAAAVISWATCAILGVRAVRHSGWRAASGGLAVMVAILGIVAAAMGFSGAGL
jgi:hypothetical protein